MARSRHSAKRWAWLAVALAPIAWAGDEVIPPQPPGALPAPSAETLRQVQEIQRRLAREALAQTGREPPSWLQVDADKAAQGAAASGTAEAGEAGAEGGGEAEVVPLAPPPPPATATLWAGEHEAAVGPYNVLVFPRPVGRLLLPPDSPLDGEPVFLRGHRVVLLKLLPSDRPVQVLAVLEDGTVAGLLLRPRQGMPPARIAVGEGTAIAAAPTNPHARYLPVLKALAEGREPPGFQPVPRPRALLLYDRLTGEAERCWQGSRARACIWRLRLREGEAGPLHLVAAQFYRPGVTAAMLDGWTLRPGTTLRLYLIEALEDE